MADRIRNHRLSIESSDSDELSDYFSRRISKVSIAPGQASASVSISANVLALGEVVAFQVEVPTGASFLQAEDLNGFFIQIPAGQGEARWKIGSNALISDETRGYVGPMHEGDAVDFVGAWGHRALKLPYEKLARTLSLLLDRPLPGQLAFEPVIDLRTGHAQALAAFVDLALASADGEPVLASSPLAAAQFGDSLSLLLLEKFRHSHSESLEGRRDGLKPMYVKRALEFMRENVSRSISLQEIAAAAGVSVRALHYGFRNFAGEAPFDVLRKMRLHGAYRDLHERNDMSISAIARKWGFSNAARFAHLCKLNYGFLPSEIRQLKRQQISDGSAR